MEQQLTYIPVRKIWAHKDNPRKDLGDLSELTDSIRQNGIMQNLTVVKCIGEISGKWDGESYRCVIGHRRLAAARLAGVESVPCIVAEMSETEQLSTMLLENMQRIDLTVYEQAQGFQMMLDLGETVESVAKQTGFSTTTVRNRIKLMRLDQKKFQKAEERGATLSDYMELDKLESVEDKNAVLDKIGTQNFQSALKSAIEAQAVRKKLAEWAEAAGKFALQIERKDEVNGEKVEMRYYRSLDRWNLSGEVIAPEDAEEVRYFYVLTDRGITIYKDARNEKDSAEEEARRERQRLEDQTQNEFKAVAKAHFELRRDFIKGLSNSAFKKNMTEVSLFCAAAAEAMGGYRSDLDPELCAYLLGMRFTEEDEELSACEIPAIRSAAEKQPEKLIFCLCYSAIDGPTESYYDYHWRSGGYVYEAGENDTLDRIYDALTALGYDLSDDEEAMRNGSHELLALHGSKPETESADDE